MLAKIYQRRSTLIDAAHTESTIQFAIARYTESPLHGTLLQCWKNESGLQSHKIKSMLQQL